MENRTQVSVEKPDNLGSGLFLSHIGIMFLTGSDKLYYFVAINMFVKIYRRHHLNVMPLILFDHNVTFVHQASIAYHKKNHRLLYES